MIPTANVLLHRERVDRENEKGKIHEGWSVWELKKEKEGKKGVVTVVKRERVCKQRDQRRRLRVDEREFEV